MAGWVGRGTVGADVQMKVGRKFEDWSGPNRSPLSTCAQGTVV